MAISFIQEDRIKNVYDPYNVIRLIVSFLSRSTQERGLTKKEEYTKGEEKSYKVKPVEKSVSEYITDSGTSKIKAS
ncbi:MAG: hypothetical protein PHF18_12140 [Methanosarcina sp.]|nr:hypothetical protein [Methanosarcina sp.]